MGIPNIATIIKDPSNITKGFDIVESYLNDLRLDVLISERVSFSFDVTSKPVEGGLPVTDASIEKPVALNIEALQTDDKYNFTSAGIDSLLNGVLTWQDKKEKLYEIKDKKQIVTLVTPTDIYKNLLITDLAIDRSSDTAYQNGFVFRMSLRSVKIVQSDIGLIDDSMIPENLIKKEDEEQKKNKKRKNEQKNENKKTPEEIDAKKKSDLAKVVDGVTDYFSKDKK